MTNNTILNPLDPSNPLVLINLSNCDKLTPLNYGTWQTQVESLLFGYDLLKYVHGTFPPPTPTIPDPKAPSSEPTTIANPALTSWQRQDRLIMGALIGTLSPTISPLVIRASTTHEAWTTLANTYANPSRGHLLHLKERLKNITKTTQSITEYMQSIKICTDQLALMGKPMDHEDILQTIINGLDPVDYRPVIEAVRARDTPITFEAFHEKLLHHDLYATPKQKTHLPASAFAASTRPTYNNNRYTNSPSRHNTSPVSTGSNAPNPFRGRCQWCRLRGHVIAYCPDFRKLNLNLVFPPPPRNSRTINHQPHAHTATTGPSFSNTWLLDSGATHHVTNNLTNLSLHHPYDGTDELIIGDGSSLPIER